MIAPADVAAFVAKVLTTEKDKERIYELEGPEQYTAGDVAKAMSGALNQQVTVSPVPREQWEEQFRQAGFSPDGISNFIEMTEAVVNGKAGFEKEGVTTVKGTIGLVEYMNHAIAE